MPPDRKRLAALRAPPSRRLLGRTTLKATRDDRRSGSCSPSAPLRSMRTGDPTNAGACESATTGADIHQLPSAVQQLLQEIYFTCQFHSTLLFLQPTFAQDFKDGHVAQHVLLAMYANATMYVLPLLSDHVVKQDLTEYSFLAPRSSLLDRYAEGLRSVGDLRAAGRRWALQAARKVLQDIDQPTFESVQTCEMLSLYWFSVGDYKRNAMFLGMAKKSPRRSTTC